MNKDLPPRFHFSKSTNCIGLCLLISGVFYHFQQLNYTSTSLLHIILVNTLIIVLFYIPNRLVQDCTGCLIGIAILISSLTGSVSKLSMAIEQALSIYILLLYGIDLVVLMLWKLKNRNTE